MWCHLITLFKRVFHQRDTLLQITVKKTKPSRTDVLTGQKEMEPLGCKQAESQCNKGHQRSGVSGLLSMHRKSKGRKEKGSTRQRKSLLLKGGSGFFSVALIATVSPNAPKQAELPGESYLRVPS